MRQLFSCIIHKFSTTIRNCLYIMTAEIITIGDEILIGQIIDTNSAFIAEHLNLIGINIRQITSISDSKEHIFTALNQASKHSELIILTGGLGPTNDDITKPSLAEYFNTKLIVNEDILNDIKILAEKKAFDLNENNRLQAEVPENCKIIRNDYGTAAGMWFEKDNTVFISMPAVPYEMKKMFTHKIIPLLKKYFKNPPLIHKTIQTFGIPESMLAEKLTDRENSLPKEIKLAYLPSPERIRLRLSCVSGKFNAEKEILNQTEKLKQVLGDEIFGYDNDYLQDVVGNMLRTDSKTVATAESCTGGYIAELITSVPGSSDYYTGSVIAYSDEIKNKILKVKEKTLLKHGAVSKETVEEMVHGVRKLYGTDYALSVSGIVGPGGGSDEKPIGTVRISVVDEKNIHTVKFNFGNIREINIRRAGSNALNLLRKLIIENKINS